LNNEKKDRRIRKTEKQLLDGLTYLMQTKSINDITVRELSDIVDINRSTFYLHYQDIYDMIEHIEDNLIEQFTQTLNSNHKRNGELTEQEFKKVMVSIFEFLLQNRTICKALIGHNGDIKFLNKINEIISERIQELLKNYASNKYSDTDLELVKHYFVSGCIGLVQCWFKYDDKTLEVTDPNHMANLFVDLIKSSSDFI
jgi:AcrR family transcriptional regulator